MAPQNFPFFFQGNLLSDVFAANIRDAQYNLILNYPATASWAAYPNTQKYFIQDSGSESTKASFDKICQKEPWKNLAVLGKALSSIVMMPPPIRLVRYWRNHFEFDESSLGIMDCSLYLDDLNI